MIVRVRRLRNVFGFGCPPPTKLCALAALIGFLSHAGPFFLLPAGLLFPAVWNAAGSRRSAATIALAYHLTAARGLPVGATTFFREWTIGLSLWLLAGAVLSLTWAVLWHPARRRRLWLLPFALVVTAVPPIGIVGWSHPATASGALFPGWSWFGLVATVAVIVGTAALSLPRGILVTTLAIGLAAALDVDPPSPHGWTSFDTTFPFAADRDLVADYARILESRDRASATTANVVVFAESIGGLWTPTTERLWLRPGPTAAVLCGAEIPLGSGYDNALVAVDGTGARVLYRQRMPVPFSMWRPFSAAGARAHWFTNPSCEFHGVRLAPLICYEQFLVWPVLHSMAARPDAIVAIANDWWCADTSLPKIQANATRAWARLFGVALVTATNT